MALERHHGNAHMLLCLAWLVRLENTTEHRDWARKIALDLLSTQDQTGGLRERLSGFGRESESHSRVERSLWHK